MPRKYLYVCIIKKNPLTEFLTKPYSIYKLYINHNRNHDNLTKILACNNIGKMPCGDGIVRQINPHYIK